MAYPSGAEIVAELPLGGKGVTPSEADERITRWKAKLEYAPESDRQQALADEIVATGARADMERLQLRRAGHVQTSDADTARREANELLGAYNAMKVTPEQEVSVPDGYAGWMSF